MVDKSEARAYYIQYNKVTLVAACCTNKPLEQVPHDKGSASSKGFRFY